MRPAQLVALGAAIFSFTFVVVVVAAMVVAA